LNERQENFKLPNEFLTPFEFFGIAKSGRIAFAIQAQKEKEDEEKENAACYSYWNYCH
jgi:hypothetical protein